MASTLARTLLHGARRVALCGLAAAVLLSGCSGRAPGGATHAGASSSGAGSPTAGSSAPGSPVPPASSVVPAVASSGGCVNLAASSAVKAQVTDGHKVFARLKYIEPVPGDFFYGRCGTTSYAATDFEAAVGAGYAESVGLQDDGSVMTYYARTGSGPWHRIAADGLPRDARGCAAIGAVPAALAVLWHGCPLTRGAVRPYLAATGWNGHDPVYEPVEVVLSGDSTLGLEGMHWSTWQLGRAEGTGTGWATNCLPSCAAAAIRRAPVRVELSGSTTVCGREYYTRMEIIWLVAAPSGLPKDYLWKSEEPSC